ncbi:hypothetical protein ACF065_26600 [Streptomyces sp. NPDC015232]|uniref:hypothetical protein n=1 Tax=unclassified Streptomyces TaxID=2593676 RepID=UPI0036FB6C14
MAETYPLVEQREFGAPEQRGGWLNRRSSREQSDLPRLAAHQVLVFRVGEDYVLDHGGRRPDDELVVSASSVSVVDRRAGVPVTVETAIPSAETDSFTLRVTFHCTVTDACAVVRDGIADAGAVLLGHLQSMPGLVEEGRDLAVTRTADLRDRVWARLRAYEEMASQVVSGLRLRVMGVEALTPQEVADAQRAREEAERASERAEFEARLAAQKARSDHERQLLEHRLRREQQAMEDRYRQETALAEERHRQEIAELQAQARRRAEDDQEEHRLRIETRANAHGRREAVATLDTFGYDPRAAHHHAFARGEITADELSARMANAEDKQYTRDVETEERNRVRLDRREEWARADALASLERDDRLLELERQRERDDERARRAEENRRWDLTRDDELQRRRDKREDDYQIRAEEREWRQQVLDARRDLTKQVINRGHGDGGHVNVAGLINGVGDSPPITGREPEGYELEEGPGEVRVERVDAETGEPVTGTVAGADDDGFGEGEESVG